jgi:hypothetical protein
MKALLAVSIAIIPILVTGAALRYVSTASRRYRLAELHLISILERHSNGRVSYENLMLVKGKVEAFLADESPDVRQLADAITSIAEAARELNQRDAEIIAGILRRDSDRNRARYIRKLLNAVEPPDQRRSERGSPEPNRPPSSSASPHALEPPSRTREK